MVGWLGIYRRKPGSYSLALECEGKSTERLPLIVEKNEISSQVSASFHFEKSGPIKMGSPIPVVFSVTNGSPFPLRFPQRGVMIEGVSLSVVRDKPAYRSDFFYPWEKLRHVRHLYMGGRGEAPFYHSGTRKALRTAPVSGGCVSVRPAGKLRSNIFDCGVNSGGRQRWTLCGPLPN